MATVLVGAFLTVLIKLGVALCGHSIAWWVAAIIALFAQALGCFLIGFDDLDGPDDLDGLGGWWS
jgi:hypothetical protein